jgi:hypothetical protein
VTKENEKMGRKRSRKSKSSKRQTSQVAKLESLNTPNGKGLPPNENLRKPPDEVYGDTEIPRREKLLGST